MSKSDRQLKVNQLLETARTTGGMSPDVQAYMYLIKPIESMGQFLYRRESPDGYPERSDQWLTDISVLNRVQFALSLINNELLGIFVDDKQPDQPARNDDPLLVLASPAFQHR